MKVAVVDDDRGYRDTLISYIDRFGKENGEEIEIIAYKNGMDFVSDYKADCDVVFLDVEMLLYDGLSAAKKIREVHWKKLRGDSLLRTSDARKGLICKYH